MKIGKLWFVDFHSSMNKKQKNKKTKKNGSAGTIFTVCQIHVINKNDGVISLVDSGNLETVVVYSSLLPMLYGIRHG